MAEINTETIFEKSNWIWAEDNTLPNDWVIFRRKFFLEKPPKKAVARISVESSYNMHINDKLVVFDGGLKRESTPGNGYYDELDIAPFLSKGDNVIVLTCNYLSKGGMNNKKTCPAGMLFECKELDLYSDKSFLVYRSGGYGKAKANSPSGLYAAYSLSYDSTRDGITEGLYTAQYGSNNYTESTVYSFYPSAPYNSLTKRPVPLFNISNIIKAKRIVKSSNSNNDIYTIELNKSCLFVPVIDMTASNGLAEVFIFSDKFECGEVNGTDGVSMKNQSIEYICKEGAQTFSSPVFLSGSKIIIKAPNTVKINSVSYRITSFQDLGYGQSEDIGSFNCNIEDINILGRKAIDTVKLCMRDSIWNTPDRERATYLGELSASSELCSYAAGDFAQDLIKKCIDDTINFARYTNLISDAEAYNSINTADVGNNTNVNNNHINNESDMLNELIEELSNEEFTEDNIEEVINKEELPEFKLDIKDELAATKPAAEVYNNDIYDYCVLLSMSGTDEPVDIPSGGLIAVGTRGFIKEYYNKTGDTETLINCIKPIAAYLNLWEMGDGGFVIPRNGEKRFFDNQFNIDEKVLENCLYYSALQFLKFAASIGGISTYNNFINQRIQSIEDNFDAAFFKKDGYTSGVMYDDRANAWAVISGLANKSRYNKLKKLLFSTCNCSPFMENYCVEALCMMGAKKEALERLNNRYRGMIDDNNSELREDFGFSGSATYASSGAVFKNLYRYFAGVEYVNGNTVIIKPDLTALSDMQYTVGCNEGMIYGSYKKSNNGADIYIINKSDLEVILVLDGESLGLSYEKKEFKLKNGKNKFSI